MLEIAITISALLLCITVHEFSHALVATILGDGTARKLGRLSLNPLVHLDPVGTIMMLVTAITGFGIGWGKPVPVNAMALRIGPKNGMALVAFAGPVSNFLFAALVFLPFRAGLVNPFQSFVVLGDRIALGQILETIAIISIVLGVFNLIPFSPLDGSSVLLGLLPMNAAMVVARFQAYGPGILMTLLLTDQMFNIGILSRFLNPAVGFFARILLGG